MAFYINTRQGAENCKLERARAEQTKNKAEHFKHWTEWSQRTIAELKAQKDKTADGSGKRDRHE